MIKTNKFNYNNNTKLTQQAIPQMNIAVFTRLWPRHNYSGQLEKTISLIESLINMNHRIVVCSDDENQQVKEKLKEYPIQLVDINSRKISTSLNRLSKVDARPNIFVFDSFDSEEKYSAFLYNRWNKCPRVLAVDSLKGLQKWRRTIYRTMPGMLLPPGSAMCPDKPEQIFTIEQQRSILRSDYILTSNEHNYHLINKHLLDNKRSKYISQINYGFPLQEYYGECSQLMYRPWRNRSHFVFLGHFGNQGNRDCLYTLVHFLWPMIRERLRECELHVYGTHGDSGINEKLFLSWGQGTTMTKEQLKKMGVQFKGVMKEPEQLSEYRALLYPAIHSTGPHIKVIQSWFMHLPVVTTPIGAQGQFLQSYDPFFSASLSGDTSSTFSSQRIYTPQQTKNTQKINSYYSNRLLVKNTSLTFGGSFQNFSYKDFIQNSIKIYENQQYWDQCLGDAQKIIKRNQNDRHLEVVIKRMLVDVEIAGYEGRGRAGYEDQWKRYTRSGQFSKKVRG